MPFHIQVSLVESALKNWDKRLADTLAAIVSPIVLKILLCWVALVLVTDNSLIRHQTYRVSRESIASIDDARQNIWRQYSEEPIRRQTAMYRWGHLDIFRSFHSCQFVLNYHQIHPNCTFDYLCRSIQHKRHSQCFVIELFQLRIFLLKNTFPIPARLIYRQHIYTVMCRRQRC